MDNGAHLRNALVFRNLTKLFLGFLRKSPTWHFRHCNIYCLAYLRFAVIFDRIGNRTTSTSDCKPLMRIYPQIPIVMFAVSIELTAKVQCFKNRMRKNLRRFAERIQAAIKTHVAIKNLIASRNTIPGMPHTRLFLLLWLNHK